MSARDLVFGAMAARDDARERSQRDYWRGYIDGLCAGEGVDREALEQEYQRMPGRSMPARLERSQCV